MISEPKPALSKHELPAFCECYLDEQPHSGCWNMACDEWLLNRANDTGACLLRIYQWEQPTLSLGYFQNCEMLMPDPKRTGLPVVKRLTGGGAILHHHEITYAVAVPSQHPFTQPTTQLYHQVHQQIINTLRAVGFPAELRGKSIKVADEPMLCFGRWDTNDIVIGTNKILGSAQRRRKGAVLQHGSLLLAKSVHAPEFLGLNDLTSNPYNTDKLPAILLRQIGESLARKTGLLSLTNQQIDTIRQMSESYRVS